MTTVSKEQKKARHHLPLLQGILPFNWHFLPAEITAGITLAALGIPEVMGYTKIAGMPVITGLYTLLLPVLVFAILGSSRHLVVGADSATAAIMAAGLAGLAAQGSSQYMALAGALAIIAAIFLIFARLVRLGFLANFLAKSVLIGFLTGVGIQVALGEVGGMIGIEPHGSGSIQKFASVLQQIPYASIPTIIISLIVLLIIIVTSRINNKIPGALIAVVLMIILSYAFNFASRYGIQVLGYVPRGLPKLSLPDIRLSDLPRLLATALSIFFVILAQSAATSRAYALRYTEDFDENVDLVGLGLANIAAGISGAFVVNGSPTKTEIVDSAGGRTQLSQITTAVIVLLVLVFLTAPLAFMPSAVLSAVVFVIGIRLIDVKGMRRVFHLSKEEFIVAAITIVVVVAIGVEQGILLAIVLSIIDHLRHSYRPFDALMTPTTSGHWKTRPVEQGDQAAPGLVVYLFGSGLYYANSARFSQAILKLIDDADPAIKWFAIEAAAITYLDFTAADTFQQIYKTLQKRGVTLVLANVVVNVKKELDHYGLTDLIGEQYFFDSLPEILNAYQREMKTVVEGPAG
ncbi:MAG TPA: SulP family inorganic anion transporter [Ktedonobacteraceae bacterium]|nr:SulP family inorganic anion transporter [Ktedonobacteraceae bacterium]